MVMLSIALCLLQAAFCVAQPKHTIAKIKTTGSLLSKERFTHRYLQVPGDQFDQVRHRMSCDLIAQALVEDGYLDASVDATLLFDDEHKVVCVTLHLHEGARYTLGATTLVLQGRLDEHERLRQVLDEQMSFIQPGTVAQQKVIDEYTQRLRLFFLGLGYIEPEVHLERRCHQDAQTLDLTYTVTLDRRYSISCEGNHYFTHEQLRSELMVLQEQGVVLPPALCADEIKANYHKQGFMDVAVTWQERHEELALSIHEGPRYAIGHIRIDEHFTDHDVAARLHALEVALYDLPYYAEEEVTHLIEKALADVGALGYWHMSFDLHSDPDHATQRVACRIVLKQQDAPSSSPHKTCAQQVLIPGYNHLCSQGPFARWQRLSEPHVVTPAILDEQRVWLKKYLAKKGYLLAQVTYELQAGEVPAIVWNIDDSAGPVTFGAPTFAGLYKVKPGIVERELAFTQGDVWDPTSLEQSIARLKKLHMFESISVQPQPAQEVIHDDGSRSYIKPITIKFSEDDPMEVRTRMGLQFVSKSFTNISWTTWKVGGSGIWKNPSGYADSLMVEADWTRYTQNIAAIYETPWIGNMPIRTQCKGYSDRFEQPLISSNNQRLYNEAHDGCAVTFFHEHPWWTASVKTGFEVNAVSGLDPRLAPAINFEPTLVDTPVPYVYCEPSLSFERCDNRQDPTQGYYATCSLKAMVPPTITQGWFVRIQLEHSMFQPVTESIVAALRCRFGHIVNANFSTILPTQRFYLGGANSLRGYETNMAPPLNEVVCDGKELWVPVGGKTMANVNAEIRFPVYQRLSGVLFTDLGILTQDVVADIAARPWLGATGLGTRFASPFGPLRFDIGWKWSKRDPEDKAYTFFFTFGHAF